MSRSTKKTPIHGIANAASEKQDKRVANRRWRSRVRQAIREGKEPPLLREVTDVWGFSKDGKHWYSPYVCLEKLMRK